MARNKHLKPTHSHEPKIEEAILPENSGCRAVGRDGFTDSAGPLAVLVTTGLAVGTASGVRHDYRLPERVMEAIAEKARQAAKKGA